LFDVGARLRQLRINAGLTTKQLAEAVGVGQSFISQVENNVSGIKLQTLEAICKALGVTLSEFFREDPEELPMDIRQLVQLAKELSPEQRHHLTRFLESLLTNSPRKE
jgi:HTH-type transcriptional repressor of puuD